MHKGNHKKISLHFVFIHRKSPRNKSKLSKHETTQLLVKKRHRLGGLTKDTRDSEVIGLNF